MFGFVIPPMKTQLDWAAARDPLASLLADAAIVPTTNELSALYYLGRYDVLINKSRLSEIADGHEFSIAPRTGRPVIGSAESLALIKDCYPDGLIVGDICRWGDPAQLEDAVANLVAARAEGLEVAARGMRAYLWRPSDDAGRAEACARLPAGMTDDVVVGLEQAHAR